jgi:hypothetical protein
MPIDKSGLLYDYNPEVLHDSSLGGSQTVNNLFRHTQTKKQSYSSPDFHPFVINRRESLFDDVLPTYSTYLYSTKLIELLEEYNTVSYTIFPVKVLKKESELVRDYFLFKRDQSIADYVDYKKSIFYYGNSFEGFSPCKESNVRIRKYFYTIRVPHQGGRRISSLNIKRLVLSNDFDLDFFKIIGYTGGYIVSERLKNRMEEAGITGVSYEPLHLLVKDSGNSFHKIKVNGNTIEIHERVESYKTHEKLLMDWISDPLQFGIKADRMVTLDERKLYWLTGESVVCYLIAYSINQESLVGFSGPIVWSFLNIDVSKLTLEELYIRYVGWYIATHMENKDDNRSIVRDPELEKFIKQLKAEGYKNILCQQLISCKFGVYYQLKAKMDNKDIVFVSKDKDYNVLGPTDILPLYERIGKDWNPFRAIEG